MISASIASTIIHIKQPRQPHDSRIVARAVGATHVIAKKSGDRLGLELCGGARHHSARQAGNPAVGRILGVQARVYGAGDMESIPPTGR